MNQLKIASNRFKNNNLNKVPVHNDCRKPILCEDVNFSSDEESSSSGDEIFLENYSTKRQTSQNNPGNLFNEPHMSKQGKSIFNNLDIIFEISDESAFSSQTTLEPDENIEFPQEILTNGIISSDDVSSSISGDDEPISDKSDTNCQFDQHSLYTEPNFDLDIDESLNYHQVDMRGTHCAESEAKSRDKSTEECVFNLSVVNTNDRSSLLSQSELISNKRTPRFYIKNNTIDCQTELLINNRKNNVSEVNEIDNMERKYVKKPDVLRKPTKEQFPIVTDLDDGENVNETPRRLSGDAEENDDNRNGSFFKQQMFKSYSKNDLKISNRYEKRNDGKKTDIDRGSLTISDKNSPNRRSQEITGSIMKMDKTIDKVTNNIVRIDNVLDKMAQFNRSIASNLEMMSDAELSSDFETQSIGAQTDSPITDAIDNNKIKRTPVRKIESSSSSESSTEKETDTEEESDTESVSLKPSPVHQLVNSKDLVNRSNPTTAQPKINPRTVSNLKSQLQHQDSDLSSLPESSICDEPEKKDITNKVKYFQKKIKINAGLYKKPPAVEPPKRLVVPENVHVKPKTVITPIPKPRNSIDGSAQGTLTRNLSTSSSESSSFFENQRTLSNSNNRGNHSPGNSDSGSILSIASNNHFERKFQRGGTSGRYASKNKIADKFGTAPKIRNHEDDEAASLSGKSKSNSNHKNPFMTQSRSYNNLNAFNSSIDNERLRSGSLAALNNNRNCYDVEGLCDLIEQHLNLANYDRIRKIFLALIQDNDHDKIEEIIDHFEGHDRSTLMDIASKAGYGLKDAESIFDMRMSRTDLHNNLRPGLSISTLSDMNYQHSIGTEKMVFWRPDIEELLPPPMKPLPKPLPTNLLKSSIISPESLQHVDNKVLEILQFEPTTFTELVSFLTRDYSKDVEKVRALFRWITMYDMKHINFDAAAPNETLIGVLRSVKCGQMSYNELFFRLCRFAGIHCQFICGYSKGAGYKPGMTIKDNRMFRNVWTAVYVAGAWRFVNCNWGARYLSSGHHEPVNYGTLTSNATNFQSIESKYRCDEFYFLTDPKQHIFEHFPDKKSWQLLTRPISLDQFMALPIVKSPFFNANLSLKRNYPETIQTKNGKVTIKINMPKAVGISCRLENRADNSILRGLTLVRVLDNQMIMVTAAPSQPGKFYLSIYVSDDWKSEEGREMACSFQIHCSEHNYDRLVTGRFPEVGVLGSTPATQNLGIVVNPSVDPFVIWEERSTMKLNLVVCPGLRIGHKMMSYDRSGQNSSPCDSYALLQNQGQGRNQYHLRFPIDAFYCLTVFGGVHDPHMPETEPMECIYRLLVDCRHAQDRIPPFPRQTSRWVGFKLLEPLCQYLDLNKVYRFRILATHCSSIAVVINNTQWHDLSISGEGLWKGKVNTGQELDNLSVYGKFGNESEDEEFIKLLDYVLVSSTNK